jgi:hypothetical protein
VVLVTNKNHQLTGMVKINDILRAGVF